MSQPKIDPMFVQCVKEEIEEGETITIVVPAEDHIQAWEERFTDEELDSITFAVQDGPPTLKVDPGAPDA